MGAGSVSSTLSSLSSCKPPPAQDDFDVFAQTRTGSSLPEPHMTYDCMILLLTVECMETKPCLFLIVLHRVISTLCHSAKAEDGPTIGGDPPTLDVIQPTSGAVSLREHVENVYVLRAAD